MNLNERQHKTEPADIVDLLSHALDSFSSAVCIADSNGEILFSNLPWQQFYTENEGNDPEHQFNYFTVCENSASLGCPQASQALVGMKGVLYGQLPDFTLQYDCHSPTEQRWFLAKVSRYFWRSQPYLLIRHENCTERVLAEAWSHEYQTRFQALFEQGAVGIVIRNLEGKILEVNPAFCTLIGYSRQETLKLGYEDISHPDDLPVDPDKLKRLLSGELSTYTIEKRYVRKNMEVVWVQLTRSVLKCTDGRPSALVSIVNDITTKKRAISRLQESEQRFSTITNAAMDAIVMMDDQGRISYWNPAARNIFGYSADEVIGQNLHYLLMPQRYQCRAFSALVTWTKTGQGDAVNKIVELVAKRKDGNEINIELSLASVQLNKSWVAVGVLRDITERKQTQQQLENALKAAEAASMAKNVFMANVSHELRSPLNSIIGFSELLQSELSGTLNNQQKEYADSVMQSSRHLLSVISQILDLSKIEAGKMTLNLEPICPVEPITLAISMYAGNFNKKGITLAEEYDPETYRTIIEGDDVKLRQIMLNLLSNACKFTPENGKVTVGCRLISREEIGDYPALQASDKSMFVEIRVQDSGTGIRAEDLPSLFQEFSQLNTTETRKHDGTGLGLALTRKMIELHGGRIKLESEFGKGSCFSFILPV